MLLITCPVCGAEGDETDFHAGGEAHIAPGDKRSVEYRDAAQRDYLFMRKNPKGLHFERWRCDRGCGKWFHAARDTVTHAIQGILWRDRIAAARIDGTGNRRVARILQREARQGRQAIMSGSPYRLPPAPAD